MFIVSYLVKIINPFASTKPKKLPEITVPVTPEITVPVTPEIVSIKERKNCFVYLVLNKNTESILAVCNSLDIAKKLGASATYNNCRVLKYKLNTASHLEHEVYSH